MNILCSKSYRHYAIQGTKKCRIICVKMIYIWKRPKKLGNRTEKIKKKCVNRLKNVVNTGNKCM